MEVRQLEMFLAVVEAGSYLQAGERLHVAHSAIHRQVKMLEEEIGEPLVYRDGRTLQLTPAGRDVEQLARRILNDIANVKMRLRESHSLESGKVQLGTGTTMVLTFLPRVLEVFRTRYSGVEVQVMTGTATEVLAAIAAGSLDLGIVFTTPVPPIDTTGLELTPLYEEEFVLIVPPGSPFEHRASVSVADLNGASMITFSRSSRMRQFIESQLASRGVRMKVVMELENEEAIERMVALGIGSAFVSRRRATAEGLSFVTLNDIDIRATASLAVSARIPMTRAAGAFRTICLECAGRNYQIGAHA
jgi:Transcriptional regulator